MPVAVSVVEARNLPLRGSLPPSTFVSVSLDGVTMRTGVVKLSAAPQFNQRLVFAAGERDDLVRVVVHERRLLRAHTLGIVEFRVSDGEEATKQGLLPKWFSFVGVRSGEVKLGIGFDAVSTPSSRSMVASVACGTTVRSVPERIFAPPSATVVSAAEVEAAKRPHFEASVRGQPRFPSGYVRPRETLRVQVIRARNLRAADASGKSDPYCIVTLNHVSHKTSVETQTLFPQWRDAVYEFGDDLNVLSDLDVLHVDVYDWDRFKHADFLGTVRIPLWTLLGQRSMENDDADPATCPLRRWFSLHSAEAVQSQFSAYACLPSRGLGEIELELSYFAAPTREGVPRTIKTSPVSRRSDYKIQNGKVWRFNMEVEVFEVRHLTPPLARHQSFSGQPASSLGTAAATTITTTTNAAAAAASGQDPTSFLFSRPQSTPATVSPETSSQRWSIVVACGPDLQESRMSSTLFWRDATFRFAGDDHRGVQRHSCLGVALVSQEQGPVCVTCLDLACLSSDMGFIDVEGMESTGWYTMLGADARALAQIKLRIALRPASETRVQDTVKVCVVLEDVRGLHALKPGTTETFALVRLGSRVLQTSVSPCDVNGQSGMHAMLAFDSEGGIGPGHAPHLSMQLLDQQGVCIGTMNMTLDGPIGEQTDEVVTIDALQDAPMVAMLSTRSNRDFWQASGHNYPSVRIRVTRLSVEEDLRPVLGLLTVRPKHLHAFMASFKHDLVLFIRFGSHPPVACKARLSCADVAFQRHDDVFRFAVTNVYDQIVFEVRDIVDVLGTRRLLIDAGKHVGSGSMSLFEAMMRHGMSISLMHHGRAKASLRVAVHYREDVSALLATDANPPPRPVPAFSIENSAAEWMRFLRIVAWGRQVVDYLRSVMAWTRPAETMFIITLLVCFATVDFLSSRPMLVVPVALHAGLAIAYRRRHDGSFIAMFLKRGSDRSTRINASLRIAVVAASELVTSGLPVACLSMSHPSQPQLVRIGRTPPAQKLSNAPRWTFDSSSWKQFATYRGASLVTWATHHGDQALPAFLVSVRKKSEDVFLQVLVHSAHLRRSDLLEETHCRIVAESGDEARTKTKSRCTWNEQLMLNARPGDPLVVSLVEGLMDLHTVCSCAIADSSNGRRWVSLLDSRGSLVGEIDLTFEWLGAAPQATVLEEIAQGVQRAESDFATEDGDEQQRHIRVAKRSIVEIQRVNIESWASVADSVHVDVYLGGPAGRFLGRGSFKLKDLVRDKTALEQPPVKMALKLEPRHDGTRNDEELFSELERHGSLGLVEIVAQISLPEAGANAMAAKRKGPLSFIEQYNALRRDAEWTYRGLHAFNDTMEKLRNTLVYAIESRTQLLFRINSVFLVVCFILPSRFIVLFVVLFLLTEKFRPHGVMVIKAKHLVSVAPTDEDLVRAINRGNQGGDADEAEKEHQSSSGGGKLLGLAEDHHLRKPADLEHHHRGADVDDLDTDDDDDGVDGDEHENGLDPKRLWRAISSRATPLIRPNLVPWSAFEVPYFCGHLRVLEWHLRGRRWRRAWVAFGPLPCELRIWPSKSVVKRPPLAHLFGITDVRRVMVDSKEHVLALQHDAKQEDLLFVVHHQYGFAGSVLGSQVVRASIGTTLFAAPSPKLAREWMQAITGTRSTTARMPEEDGGDDDGEGGDVATVGE